MGISNLNQMLFSRKEYRMKMLKFALPLAMLAASSAAAFAGPVVLNMSGLGDEEAILNYFNGGYGGNGSGPGPSDGIVFSSNSLAIISESQGGSGNFDNNPSGGPIAFFLSGSADTMDVAAGFNTGFSFYYSTIETGSVTVWSGLDGTGTLLATIDLPANTPGAGCPAGDPYTYCEWDEVGVSFAGTAESVNFGGAANYIGFDDITIGSQTAGGGPVIPEPSSLFLLGTGLVGFAGTLRNKFARKA
jgi:hypothetical protein